MAEIPRGGRPGLRTSIRGPAAFYTGQLTEHNAAAAGLCDGEDADLDTAGALFAGPAPWMPDMF